jgi:glycosyltransferase involved in cell wall biosynthesis
MEAEGGVSNLTQEKCRIAFFESWYLAFYGAQRSMHTLVTNLDKERFSPFVVTTAEGELSKRFAESDIPVAIIPLAPIANVFGKQILRYSIWRKFRVGFEILKFNLRSFRWLRMNDINVVYVNDLRSLFYTGLAARLLRLPVVWYVRADERYSTLFGWASKLSTMIILIAKGVENAFTDKELRDHARKIHVLHTGFEVQALPATNEAAQSLRQKLGFSQNDKLIGLVGSITPRKGQDILVEAAPGIVESISNAHFLIIGDVTEGYDDYEVDLKKRVRDLELEQNFHWLGYRTDIKDLYSILDLLVLPSRFEGLPRTVVEGLAAGRPVIASDAGGAREIIIGEDFGKIIEKEDPKALKDAVITFLQEPDREEEKSVLRNQHVRDHFSISAYIEGFTKLIEHDSN